MLTLIEGLESRQFLSGSPNAAVSPAVLADRLKIAADFVTLRLDTVTANAALEKDLAAIKADDKTHSTTLKPLIAQYRSDVSALFTKLAADRQTQQISVLTDEAKILTDRAQILKDHGNPTAVKADRAQLLADRIQLQNDELAGLNARIADRQSAYTAIFADLDAINSAVQNDATASAKLKSDVSQLLTDRTSKLSKVLADLQQIATDRTQLVTDLTALQTTSV